MVADRPDQQPMVVGLQSAGSHLIDVSEQDLAKRPARDRRTAVEIVAGDGPNDVGPVAEVQGAAVAPDPFAAFATPE